MSDGDKNKGLPGWLLVVISIMVCLFGYQGVKMMTAPPETENTSQAQAAPVVTVSTQPVATRAVSDELALTGTIQARDLMQVSSELSGMKVARIYADEGDSVNRGQVLASLNTDLLETQLRQLRARYSQQEAALAKARNPQRPLEVAQLESALRQAQTMIDQEQANLEVARSSLADAQRNATRYEELFQRGAIAEAEVESRRLELQRQRGTVAAAGERVESARFAARQAEERLRLARQGGRSEDIEISQAQLAELSAQIEEVQTRIDKARLTSPDDGLVLTKQASLGQIVSPGVVLFELARNGELELQGELPATEVDRIEVGQQANVTAGSLEVQGRVRKISPLVDPTSRNAQVLISLPDKPGLRQGMYAQATIALPAQQALVVPQEALRGESPDQYVFLYQDGKAVRREVTTAGRTDGQVQVRQGLQQGDPVIVEGGGFLRDGDPVSLP